MKPRLMLIIGGILAAILVGYLISKKKPGVKKPKEVVASNSILSRLIQSTLRGATWKAKDPNGKIHDIPWDKVVAKWVRLPVPWKPSEWYYEPILKDRPGIYS